MGKCRHFSKNKVAVVGEHCSEPGKRATVCYLVPRSIVDDLLVELGAEGLGWSSGAYWNCKVILETIF